MVATFLRDARMVAWQSVKITITLIIFIRLFYWLWLMPNTDLSGEVVFSQVIQMTPSYFSRHNYGQTSLKDKQFHPLTKTWWWHSSSACVRTLGVLFSNMTYEAFYQCSNKPFSTTGWAEPGWQLNVLMVSWREDGEFCCGNVRAHKSPHRYTNMYCTTQYLHRARRYAQ